MRLNFIACKYTQFSPNRPVGLTYFSTIYVVIIFLFPATFQIDKPECTEVVLQKKGTAGNIRGSAFFIMYRMQPVINWPFPK